MKKLLSCFLLVSLILSCFALNSCGDTADNSEGLKKARDYVFEMYKDGSANTASDYNLTSVVMIDGVQYKIAWSADAGDNVQFTDDGKNVTVTVNGQTPVEIKYVLTATVSDENGNTMTATFNKVIPAFVESGFNEYAAAEKGAALVVKGVVTGVIAKSKGNTNNCLYMQDDNGGIYVYALSDDPAEAGIKPGMTVRATGSKDIYNGTLELASPSVEIVDSAEKIPAGKDYTEIFKKAASLKDEALVSKQALLVTIKGVEITGQEASSGYYKFKLGNLESYVRISSSVCPLTKNEQESFKKGHTEHTGWTANVTGVICVYDGAFYLTPVSADAFEYLAKAEKSDAEKLAFEKDALTLAPEVLQSCELDLAAAGSSYPEVKVSWTSDNKAAVVDSGKLKINMNGLTSDVTVKVVATLKCGSATDKKEFSLKLVTKLETYDVAGAIKAMAGYTSGQLSTAQVTVTGVVSESSYNSKYGSYTIWLKNGDTAKAFEFYSAVCADGVDKNEYHEANALAGYTVTCTGYLQLYVNSSETIYEIGYLSASKSPTGAATSPVISSITK